MGNISGIFGFWNNKKIHAYPVINRHDIQSYAVEYENRLLCWIIGTPKSRKTHAGVELGTDKIVADRDVEKLDFDWKFLFMKENMPQFFTFPQVTKYMENLLQTASGNMTLIKGTVSSEPAVYEDKDELRDALIDYDIPSDKIQETIYLPREPLIFDAKIEYMNIFAGTKESPIWQPIIVFRNSSDKPTMVYRAELQANDDELISIDDNVNMLVMMRLNAKQKVSFYLNKSLEKLSYIKGTITLFHNFGTVCIDIDYNITEIVKDFT